MKFLLLSLINVLVMGSTFVFTCTSIRISAPEIAANFIIFGLAQNASSLFSDRGKTSLAFRQTLKNPNQKRDIYSSLIRNRLIMNFPIQVLAYIVFILRGIGFLEWLIFLMISTTVLFYSIGLSMFQAEASYSKVYLVQILNVFGFISSSYILSRLVEPSLRTILLYLLFAWLPVALFLSKSIFRLLSNSSSYVEYAEDKKYFSGILFANFITMNFNGFVLGIVSSSLLVLYTVSSMPLLMFMPFSASLSILTFHKFNMQSFENSRSQIFKSLIFCPFLLLVGTLAAPLIQKALEIFFGNRHVSSSVVQIQMITATMSLFTGLFGNLYAVTQLSQINRWIAYSQSAVVVILGATGALLHSIVVLALADLIARLIGLLIAIRYSS